MFQVNFTFFDALVEKSTHTHIILFSIYVSLNGHYSPKAIAMVMICVQTFFEGKYTQCQLSWKVVCKLLAPSADCARFNFITDNFERGQLPKKS